jgi:hypothetical protein
VCVHSDSLELHCIVCCDDYTTTPAGVETDETATEATVTRSVPRLLECGHTLCHACVEHLAFGGNNANGQQLTNSNNSNGGGGGGMVSCPVCRQLTKAFHWEDVKANGNHEAATILIPTNDALIAVINQQQLQLNHGHGEGDESDTAMTSQATAVHCGNCEEGQVQPATVRCIPCAIYFCNECFNSVHGGKVRLRQFSTIVDLECTQLLNNFAGNANTCQSGN